MVHFEGFFIFVMESHDNLDMPISGGAPVGSRWNPTKEQIDMLESLYKQGLRTPSAEQIQQITNRLRAYGHIEGKNVFYWFQNHKARQRQKQKQDHVSPFNRFLHKTASVLPSCTNGRSFSLIHFSILLFCFAFLQNLHLLMYNVMLETHILFRD